MDDFDGFDPAGEGLDGPEPFDDPDPTAPVFDAYDDDPVPDAETDPPGFEYDPDPAFDDDFALDDDLTPPDNDPPDTEATEPGHEAPYTATYEDLLIDQADNPAAFPPELDLDVPEPVDGYPWIDLDQLGPTETEPWVNTTDTSPFNATDLDIDDPAGGALSRFWEM